MLCIAGPGSGGRDRAHAGRVAEEGAGVTGAQAAGGGDADQQVQKGGGTGNNIYIPYFCQIM